MLMDNITFVESLKYTPTVQQYRQYRYTVDYKALANDIKAYMGEEGYQLSSAIDDKVWSAMRRVDRRAFLPETILSPSQSLDSDIAAESPRDRAYLDEPVVIYMDRNSRDGNQVQTCSQSSLVAVMVDALGLKRGMKVLEIGAGCGHHAAIVSRMLGIKGHLYTLERIPDLEYLAKVNLHHHFGSSTDRRLTVIPANGFDGFEKGAPYDAIYLTAGVEKDFNPDKLVSQLRPEMGVLLFPERAGNLYRLVCSNGKVVGSSSGIVLKDVTFVPLVKTAN